MLDVSSLPAKIANNPIKFLAAVGVAEGVAEQTLDIFFQNCSVENFLAIENINLIKISKIQKKIENIQSL